MMIVNDNYYHDILFHVCRKIRSDRRHPGKRNDIIAPDGEDMFRAGR